MKNQYLAALSVNLLTLIYGISVGWTAPNIILFQSEDSPVGQLSTDELSPITSLLCVGGVLGTLFFGWATDKFGRKYLLLFMAIFEIISLVLILAGNHRYYIYVSRVFAGLFGGGVFVLIPIFVTEISDPKIRGTLGSILVLFCNFGILLGFILSSMFGYLVLPYVSLATIAFYLIVFVLFPESPEFLMMKMRNKDAEKSFKFYKGVSRNKSMPDDLQLTYDQLIEVVTKQNETQQSKGVNLGDFQSKAVRLGFLYSVVLITFVNFCGAFVIMNYLTFLFKEASIEIDIYVCTILVGVIQIGGSYLPLLLVDRFGRRPLLMVSAFGTGLSIGICGIYYYLLTIPSYSDLLLNFQWLPLITLSSFVLLCNMGVVALPFFTISELLPTNLRGFVTTVCVSFSWLLAFLLLQFFQFFLALIGIYGIMGFFAFCCFIEVIFVYYFLPETKGITYHEIQCKLNENRL